MKSINYNIRRTHNKILIVQYKIITNLLTIITLNKSLFKLNLFSIIILIFGIFCSIMIRLDFNLNWLVNINETTVYIFRISSATYRLYILLLLITNWRQILNYLYLWRSTIKNNYLISIFYIFYHLFISLITFYIINIKYYSISTLNIEFLNFFYLVNIFLTICIGIYCSIKYINPDFNLNKIISRKVKIICSIGIVTYITWIILLRYGIFVEMFNKISDIKLFDTIHCEDTSEKYYLNKISSKDLIVEPRFDHNGYSDIQIPDVTYPSPIEDEIMRLAEAPTSEIENKPNEVFASLGSASQGKRNKIVDSKWIDQLLKYRKPNKSF